ncbi:MAG: long-chain fatty acid--CoA ligase [Oligoflexia bacterium]|nr:long-chain fatty acid--CoA ligase [Oligoflexia bacterium]
MTASQYFEADWLKRWAHYSPEAVAFKDADTGREITYRALLEQANFLAYFLRDKYAIRAGDRVAVLATNELEFFPLFYATQRLGAILVPMNFRLAPREIAHILGDSAPKLLIHQRQFQEVVDKLDRAALPAQLLHFDGDDSLSTALTATEDRPLIEMGFGPETPILILYTSGTTGSPKGAILTQGSVFWNSINTGLRLNLIQSDVTLAFLPLFHTGGWNVLTTPLLHRGGKSILVRKFDPERVLQLCDSEGVTILFGVPTMMDMMYRTPLFTKASLKTVRYAIVGGEPMPVDLIRTWEAKGIPIRQGYGLTEFGPSVFSLNEEDSIRKIGSIGFPNFYIDVKIVDNDGRELSGADEIGELLLRGPACMAGYWNRPEATAATIQDGWLRTGDLVRRDAEGYFYVVGRKKDMYISGGENVYPAEIEQFLRSHPKIHEAAVIGVPDARWGEVGKAFLTLHPGQALTEQEMAEYCLGNLAKYKIPKYFRFVKELPKGDSGKILKRALAELPA